MSIDLGAVLGVARGVADQILDTSGTTISISRSELGRGEGGVDPVTLIYEATEPEVIVDETPAFLAAMGAGALNVAAGEGMTATPVQVGSMLVLIGADVVDVQEQDIITVISSLDDRLVGRVMDVTTILDSSAGALRVLHAQPRDLGPGDL